jgi:hypothetical protein
MEQRLLAVHQSFEFGMAGHRTRLQPDAMFLFQASGKGMMVNLIEIDCGTSHESQFQKKLESYAVWLKSRRGSDYLTQLYSTNGASNRGPRVGC